MRPWIDGRSIAMFMAASGLATACLFTGACQSRSQTVPASPPPVPAYTPFSPQTPAASVPATPMRQFAPGLMVRTMYAIPAGTAGARHQVEIWELLTGPGRKAEKVTLPGAAVLEVASGQGTLGINGKPREVRTGDVLAVNEGDSLDLESRAGGVASGLMIRATLVRRTGN